MKILVADATGAMGKQVVPRLVSGTRGGGAGSPGALLLDGRARLIAVWTSQIADGQIQGINCIVNPETLGHPRAVGNLNTLLQRSGGRGAPA
jgi:hypothetical protein